MKRIIPVDTYEVHKITRLIERQFQQYLIERLERDPFDGVGRFRASPLSHNAGANGHHSLQSHILHFRPPLLRPGFPHCSSRYHSRGNPFTIILRASNF